MKKWKMYLTVHLMSSYTVHSLIYPQFKCDKNKLRRVSPGTWWPTCGKQGIQFIGIHG